MKFEPQCSHKHSSYKQQSVYNIWAPQCAASSTFDSLVFYQLVDQPAPAWCWSSLQKLNYELSLSSSAFSEKGKSLTFLDLFSIQKIVLSLTLLLFSSSSPFSPSSSSPLPPLLPQSFDTSVQWTVASVVYLPSIMGHSLQRGRCPLEQQRLLLQLLRPPQRLVPPGAP